MNICEQDLIRAVTTFLREAGIPQPEGWNRTKDGAFLYNRIYPAFLKALEQIEPVNLCHGFDLDRIKELRERKEKHNEESA